VLKYGYLCAGSGGNVGKLGRDVTAADQQYAARKRVQCQESLVSDQVLFAGNAELDRFRAGCKQNMFRFKRLALHY
jgi:hypothetical protein